MAKNTLERRKRRAARLALYGSLALLALAAWLLIPWLQRPIRHQPDATWGGIDFAALEPVRLLQRYVQLDTSATTGSEVEGARFLAGELRAAGLEPHLEVLGSGNANLWAILEGEEPEAVVLHHHIDVTPIQRPERWDFPPFGGTLKPPWIYGRGVFDMKSLAIAQLTAFLELARRPRPPRRSVILLATGDEERGSDLGTRWVLSQHPELVGRFGVVLTEGGVVEAVNRRDVKYWGIEFAQQQIIPALACSSSRQRLELLRSDLARLSSRRDRLQASEVVRRFLAAYGPSRAYRWNRALLRDPVKMTLNPLQWAKIPDYLKPMFRHEAFAYPVERTPDGSWATRINIQVAAGGEPREAVATLLPTWVVEGVEVSVGAPRGSGAASPLDHPLYRRLEEAVSRRYPAARPGPYLLSWRATDARYYRAAGIPAYGFSPFLIFSTDTLQVDAPNERMALPGFVEGVDFMSAALESLVE